MGPDDLNGLERLRYTEGFWKWVAILGLILMMVGLGIFGFAILSAFMATERIPQMPASMPIGFGIAMVGAIAYWAGLAFGVPRDSDYGRHKIHVGPEFHADGDLTFYGPVDARVTLALHQRRITIVNRLDQALSTMTLPEEDWPEAETAFQEVRAAVEADAQPEEIASRLRRLAGILQGAGAVAGGASTAIQAIRALAATIGA
jgi:hypothetical protein